MEKFVVNVQVIVILALVQYYVRFAMISISNKVILVLLVQLQTVGKIVKV